MKPLQPRGKGRRAMRCPRCTSLQTVKNGSRTITVVGMDRRTTRAVVRYWCRRCGHYFSLRREAGTRYSVSFKLEAARMHVEERMSYRVMAKRLRERLAIHVTPRRLCTMVNEVAAQAKGSLAIASEFHPQWSGYLLIDDKYVSVRGVRMMSLLAADRSGDAVHSELLEAPTQEAFTAFVHFIVERLAYPLKAVTSDFDERIAQALEGLPDGPVLHQRCQWHALQKVKQLVNYFALRRRLAELERRFRQYHEQQEQEHVRSGGRLSLESPAWVAELEMLRQEYARQEALLEAIGEILRVPTGNESQAGLLTLHRQYGERYHAAVAWLQEHLDLMLTWQEDPQIPKTNNIAENLNKQLERRFKTIEAFQSVETAWNYQTLLRNYLRFKPYTDCRGARQIYNGMSPLEVCGVHLDGHDWLRQATFWSEISAAK